MTNTVKTILLIIILAIVAIAIAGIAGLNDDGSMLREDESNVQEQQENTESEIEADPLLVNTAWKWEETQYSNDDLVTPSREDFFIARFTQEGRFSSTTDCNNLMGTYERGVDSSLSFGPLASTLMACTGDMQEQVYAETLNQITHYMIDEEGRLILLLRYDSGSMIFSPYTELDDSEEGSSSL